MPDRDEVIEAFEICYVAGHNCTECRYFSEDGCNDKLMQDALALLREHDTVEHALEVLIAHEWKDREPVEPKPTGIEPHYNCGACGLPITQGYPFCPWCGRKVKWE